MNDSSIQSVEEHLLQIEQYLQQPAAQPAVRPRSIPPSSAPSSTALRPSSHTGRDTPSSISELSCESLPLSRPTSAHSIRSVSSQSSITAPTSTAPPPPAPAPSAASALSHTDKEALIQKLLAQHRANKLSTNVTSVSSLNTRPPPAPATAQAREQLIEQLLADRRRMRQDRQKEQANGGEEEKKTAKAVFSPPSRHAPTSSLPPRPAAAQAPAPVAAAPPPASYTSPDARSADTSSSSSMSSRSHISPLSESTTSPIDPRFLGDHRTIFEAAELLDEHGELRTDLTQQDGEVEEGEEEEEKVMSPASQTSFVDQQSTPYSPIPHPTQQQQQHNKPAKTRQEHKTTKEQEMKQSRKQEKKSTQTAVSSSPLASTATSRARTRVRYSPPPPTNKPAYTTNTTHATTTSNKRPATAKTQGTAAQTSPKPKAKFITRTTTSTSPVPKSSTSASASPSLSPERKPKLNAAQKAAIAFEKACPFKPVLLSKQIDKEQVGSLADRLSIWQQRQAEREKLKQQQMIQQEQEQMQACTFQPAINEDSRRYVQDGRGELDDRLHHEADHRTKIREAAAQHQQQVVEQACPFQPVISEESRRIQQQQQGQEPVWRRVAELQRQKEQRLHQLRMQQQKQEQREGQLTFHPNVNETSQQLAKERKVKEQQLADEQKEKRASSSSPSRPTASASAAAAAAAEHCTFKPSVSAASERILKRSRLFKGGNRDFLSRQQSLQQQQQERMQAVHSQLAEQQQQYCPFVPDIGNAKEVLANARPQLQDEQQQEQSTRLSSYDAQLLQKLKGRLIRRAKEEYTFKPEIGEVSRRIARSSSVDALYKNERRQQAMQELQAKAEQVQSAQCTFKPQLNKQSNSMAAGGRYGSAVIEKIEAEQALRSNKLAAIHQQLQLRQLEQCTFAPTTTSLPTNTKAKPVLVRGMNRFLQLKEMTARQQQAQQQREREVFLLDVQDSHSARGHAASHRVYTIPAPFKLSERERKDKSKYMSMQDEKECTFQPQTTTAANRKLIQYILQEDPDWTEDMQFAAMEHDVQVEEVEDNDS